MSVAVSIISAVLKSVFKSNVENELVNELIGISVDSVSEKGLSKINDFIDNGKSKVENILSEEKMKSMDIPEDNIAYIVAEIKNLLSEIEITDGIFRQCKYNSLKLRDFLWSEYSENRAGYLECESDIEKSLLSVSETLIKLLRESEDFIQDISVQISNTIDDTRSEMKEEFNTIKENFNKLDSYSQMILDILLKIIEQNQKSDAKKKSRTQKYAEKWNVNMFLNDFDKRDENAGINVKLSDVYIDDHLPYYIWGNNGGKSTDLKDLLTEYIEERSENKMLLILGQPGIGKSTLITWIVANFKERVDDTLVYQFASDLKDVDWTRNNISERILEELSLSYSNLSEKIIIFDGYDEISITEGERKEILDELYWNLIKKEYVNNFLLIITCRENYIKNFERVQCKYITLQPWHEKQIRSFCNIFQEKTNKNIFENTIEKLIDNREIFGIPLILYMVLALNISIEKEGSIVDVYDKIFSIEGGIYDRCIDFKRFADSHRISKIKKLIHQISREIAIWMFENKHSEAYIPQKEYSDICAIARKKINNNEDLEDNEGLENIESDFAIGNFFKLKHCEGKEGEQLYFVHRSIYEYFFVEYLFCSICKVIGSSKEDLESVFGKFLKGNILSLKMLEYFKIKILNSKLRDNFDIVNRSFQIMLQDGMTYHASKNYKDPYKNVMDCEMKVFCNMLEIIHLWDNFYVKFNDSIIKYIRYNYAFRINLSGADLSGVNLSRADLDEVDLIEAKLNEAKLNEAKLNEAKLIKADLIKAELSRAKLSRAKLSRAKLNEADLSGADLSGADLRGADLRGADLSGVDLSLTSLKGVILDETNVKGLKSKSNLRLTKVFISSRKEIISYIDYCKMKNGELC